MDILTALNDRLHFIKWFYLTAARPFTNLMRKHPTCHEPRGRLPDEFENEKWREADKGRETLAHCCLSLVSKAIQDYLLYFIMREVGAAKPDDVVPPLVKLTGKSKFEKYENFLREKTTFNWDDSPVPRDRVEQINLCRDDFLHDHDIDSDQPKQRHSRKYPDSRFVDPVGQAAQAAIETVAKDPAFAQIIAELGDPAETPEGLSLTATRELFNAIADARQFCAFVETKKRSKR